MVENWFKEMIFFHCGPWFPQELITASAICFEFWTYNHGQKSWDTFAFLGRFPIHTGPTTPLTPQTVLHACIQNFFRVLTLYSVGGKEELQENFEKYALFWEGTEKWQKNMNFVVLSRGVLSRIVGLSPCQENQITLRGTGHTTELVRVHSRPQSHLA